VKARAEAGT